MFSFALQGRVDVKGLSRELLRQVGLFRNKVRRLAGERLFAVAGGSMAATPATPAPQVPRLAGRHEDHLVRTLQEFRAAKRLGSTSAMNEALCGLKPEELDTLAYYMARHAGKTEPQSDAIPGNCIAGSEKSGRLKPLLRCLTAWALSAPWQRLIAILNVMNEGVGQ
jgi:hypothetical protein